MIRFDKALRPHINKLKVWGLHPRWPCSPDLEESRDIMRPDLVLTSAAQIVTLARRPNQCQM